MRCSSYATATTRARPYLYRRTLLRLGCGAGGYIGLAPVVIRVEQLDGRVDEVLARRSSLLYSNPQATSGSALSASGPALRSGPHRPRRAGNTPFHCHPAARAYYFLPTTTIIGSRWPTHPSGETSATPTSAHSAEYLKYAPTI